MAEAEDRTEEPSARRLEQAREEGNVAYSREMQILAGLVAGWIGLIVAAGRLGPLYDMLRGVLDHAGDIRPGSEMAVLGEVSRAAFMAVLPVCGGAALAIVVAGALQTQFLLRPAGLMPKFSRINPVSGFSRLFGVQTLVETLKSVAKCVCFGGVLWWRYAGLLPDGARIMGSEPGVLAAMLWQSLPGTVGALLGVQAVIAIGDVLWTRLHRLSGLRMSRQEQRDEYRQTEGDPHVKGRLRAMRARRSRRRMMEAVKTATVVITNPTHYAIALHYERGLTSAPRIVAKGVDDMAARIRGVAQDHFVPMVANPLLARALYPLPLDSEIPAEHFKVVAAIIGYVLRLRSPAA